MPDASTRVSLLDRLRDTADQVAWREFADRYSDLLLRYALQRGLAIHDAEDAVQASLVRLSRSLTRFEYRAELGTFRAYLRRVVENEIRRAAERRRSRPSTLPIDAERDVAAPESGQLEEIWNREWMDHHYRLALAAVRDVVEPQTFAAFESLLSGTPVAEVAAAFSMSADNVYKIKQRMRDRLREAVESQLRAEEFRERRS